MNLKKAGLVMIVMAVLGFLIKLFWIVTITAGVIILIRIFSVYVRNYDKNPDMWKDWSK